MRELLALSRVGVVMLCFQPALASVAQEAIRPPAVIDFPYQDLRQQAIPFGLRSFLLAPWKSYLDTWPASQYLNCLGINFNVAAEDAQALADLLKEAHFSSARVEIGWGNLDYDDPAKIRHAEQYAKVLRVLRDHDIRPLILLNSNAAAPVPFRFIHARLVRAAHQGDREIYVENCDGIRCGYTGFFGVTPETLGFPLITAVDPATGRCQLSSPLPKDLPIGPVALADLKYHPFTGPVLSDGTKNDWSEETIAGWKTYVLSVCKFVKACLGTENEDNAGFDVEVWNELSFGSTFLDEAYYYNPKRSFSTGISYENHGLVVPGAESILPITVDLVRDPQNQLPGVKVISGFSNQRPWDAGSNMWPGQTGFSRHFYSNLAPDAKITKLWGHLSPETNNRPNDATVNALGTWDGILDRRDWYTVFPGSFFVPSVSVAMPESLQYGYCQEYITRDLQPFPSFLPGHFRYSNRGDGQTAEFWMTETNTGRFPWLNALAKRLQMPNDDPRLVSLSHHVGAKALLRMFLFESHKGVHTIEAYAPRQADLQLAILPEAFFRILQQNGHQLTAEARAASGEQLKVLTRVDRLMAEGEPLSVTRPITVNRVVEPEPRLVFHGDRTPQHPDRLNCDDFAVLPFQLTAKRFAIPFYVVTQNMVQDWRPQRDPLDPVRYDMPPEIFELELGNIRGLGAKVSVWDPFINDTVPAQVLAATANTLKVRVEATDYPRFLLVDEAKPGPLIVHPVLIANADGSADISFDVNAPAKVRLTWGPWPDRRGAGQESMVTDTRIQYKIPALAVHEGVHLEIEEDGLVVPWPRWDYDVAGIVWPKITDYGPQLNPQAPPSPRLPGLLKADLYHNFSSQLPSGRQWKDRQEWKVLQIKTSSGFTTLYLGFLRAEPATASKLLPDLSIFDDCCVETVRLNGAEGWRVKIKFDPAYYRSDLQPSKSFLIFPLTDGWVELRIQGTQATREEAQPVVDQILSGLKFY
jgi:hypothetical protein